MAAISFALLDGKSVSIDEALKLKSSRSSPKLTCPECSQSVRIHRAGGHMPAHFEHRKRNPNCSLSHVMAKDADKSERDHQPWTDDEVRASVVAYLAMLQQFRDGAKVAKKRVYAELAKRFGRTEKSFEYRMQNISYVLALVGRTWLPGLRPAKNIGSTIATKIESILGELEGRTSPQSASFEIEVNNLRRQASRPSGNRVPPKASVTITQYVRDPHVKAWVLTPMAPFLKYIMSGIWPTMVQIQLQMRSQSALIVIAVFIIHWMRLISLK
jgi:hypothetical protein